MLSNTVGGGVMALVTSLEQSSKDRQSVHRPTRCLYTIVEGPEGQRFLQLDTVGSDNRDMPEKVSQSIQFDREAAGQLLVLIRSTFPDLAGHEIQDDSEEDLAESEGEVIEGKLLFKLHRIRERNPRLIRRKKKAILEAFGQLACEICGFDFLLVYGQLGEGFAECHHRVPLSELGGTTVTRLADLAIVCPNCHRMLHRQPGMMVEQLRDIVLSLRVQYDVNRSMSC
jgi:HNH endonuclease